MIQVNWTVLSNGMTLSLSGYYEEYTLKPDDLRDWTEHLTGRKLIKAEIQEGQKMKFAKSIHGQSRD